MNHDDEQAVHPNPYPRKPLRVSRAWRLDGMSVDGIGVSRPGDHDYESSYRICVSAAETRGTFMPYADKE